MVIYCPLFITKPTHSNSRCRSSKGKFVSKKCQARYLNVLEVMKQRHRLQENSDAASSLSDAMKNQQHLTTVSDHDYALRSDSDQQQTDECFDEEVVIDTSADESMEISDSWRSGRRVVDLGVLADGLSKCTFCSYPLHLSDTVGETIRGLGGYLHVVCKNSVCQEKNLVPYGKQHECNKESK